MLKTEVCRAVCLLCSIHLALSFQTLSISTTKRRVFTFTVGRFAASDGIPEPVYLSQNHITLLRKESSKRLANNRMPVIFLAESETRGEFEEASLTEIGQALATEELVQVRGISRDAKKQTRKVADNLAMALSVHMGEDVNLVDIKGHTGVFYCPFDDDSNPQKIKLFTSVGKKTEWVKKPKPVRDNRGQIIKGLYE